jgi:hypothetical protein
MRKFYFGIPKECALRKVDPLMSNGLALILLGIDLLQ